MDTLHVGPGYNFDVGLLSYSYAKLKLCSQLKTERKVCLALPSTSELLAMSWTYGVNQASGSSASFSGGRRGGSRTGT